MTAFAFSRTIGPVPVQCVIREKHNSRLTITKVPIEFGADVTDHAYREPYELSLEIVDESGAPIWLALKAFQQTRVPFSIVSGLDVYSSMLIENLDAERSNEFSSTLKANVDLSEIIIVGTATAPDEGGQERKHGEASGTNSTRSRRPTSQTTNGTGNSRRAAGRVSRGNAVPTQRPTSAASTVPSVPTKGTPSTNRSILSQMVGP